MLRFTNSGEIDSRLITTLGVNVKENGNSPNGPIGYFGTGLKYAIAGVLRNGGSIEIHSGETRYCFATQTEVIRGKEFQFILISRDSEVAFPLGFTTELGKNWLPWMFYREIAANTIDEGGQITQVKEVGDPTAGETNIYVNGLDKEWHQRGKIFLTGEPVVAGEYLGVFPSERFGNNMIYYRGVQVLMPQAPALFRYNLTCDMELTEDRTLASAWEAESRIGEFIATITDEVVLEKILLAGEGSFEHTLDFDWPQSNPTLDAVIERLMETELAQLNPSAVVRVKKKYKEAGPKASTITGYESTMLASAKEFMASKLSIHIVSDINVTESLGPRVHGAAWGGTIYVSRLAFEEGLDHLIVVLIEEWLHVERNMRDCSREIQTWLLNKIVAAARSVEELPDMIEDILAEYAAEGFVVSNTFQRAEGDWVLGKAIGWDVYIRNLHNTRSAHGFGATLAEALRDAFVKAMTGPTYTRPPRDATGPTGPRQPERTQAPAKAPLLGMQQDDFEGDLF